MNARTGARFAIRTDEGDSEVVLVTDEAVFYRVNDALYRAEIRDGRLGAAIQIAAGGEIAAVHWAFFGRGAVGQ